MKLAAAGALLVGVLVFLGWIFDLPVLKDVIPGRGSMKANAALCFMLCGTAMACPRQLGGWVARGCAILVATISILTLAEYGAGLDFGIDQLLIHVKGAELYTLRSPRMAPITALCFLPTAAGLWLMSWPCGKSWRLAMMAGCGFLVAAMGLVSNFGYLANLRNTYGWWTFTGMSLHGAVVFVVLGAALVKCAWRESGLRWLIEPWTTVWIGVALVLLATVAALSHRSTRRVVEVSNWVTRSEVVLAGISKLRNSVDELQREIHGFQITGTDYFLPFIQDAIPSVPENLENLRKLTSDDPEQQRRLNDLAQHLDERLRVARSISAQRSTAGFTVADIDGESTGQAISEGLAEMERDEKQLLELQKTRSKTTTDETFLLLPMGTLVSLVLLFWGVFRLNQEAAARQKSSDALALSSRRLKLAVEAAEIGEWTLNSQMLSTNRTLKHDQIFGYDEMMSEWGYEKFLDHVHPEDRARVEQILHDSLAAGHGWEYECRIVRRDGSIAWIWVLGTAIKDDAGRVIENLGIVRDVTERKNAEDLLARQAAELDTLYATAPAGLFFFDTELRFVRINQLMAELNGLPVEQHIGRTIREILSEDLADAVEPLLRQVLDTGQPILNYEVSGSTLPRSREPHRYWLVSYHRAEREDGTVTGVHGVVAEITDRKMAEEALRKSEEVLALAVEAGQLGIWDWNETRATLVWSPRCNTMTGLPPETLTSEAVAMQAIHPDDRARVSAEAHLAFESKKNLDLEFRTVWPDGTERWLQARGCAFYSQSGEFTHITGIMQDVTERRETEEALRRINAELESLVDERTKLIQTTMQELREEIAERRRLEEEIIGIGERERARLGQDLHDELGQQLVGISLLMQVLSSNLSAESHPGVEQAARLESFLNDLIVTIRNLAKSLYPVELERDGLMLMLEDLALRTEAVAHIDCTVRNDGAFRFEKAAEIHLYRIAQESITNALKHGKATDILIECAARDGMSTLTVTDNGSGFVMPEEGKWTGIGLHIFQYRARLIGGKITVSRGEIGGCQVRCSFR